MFGRESPIATDDEAMVDMGAERRNIWTGAKRHRWPVYALCGLVLASFAAWSAVRVADASGAEPEADGAAAGASESSVEVTALVERAQRANEAWRDVERYYDRQVQPIERVLLQYREDPELVQRIALSLVRNAAAVDLEPRLLLAVLLVENPWLDPEIRSSVGAVGLMQVMPQHRGNWAPCAPDLEDVSANICHGARIFAHYFRLEDGDVERALLRYNGCVRGTNTPDCHDYPYHVYARAGRASVQAWLRPRPPRAALP